MYGGSKILSVTSANLIGTNPHHTSVCIALYYADIRNNGVNSPSLKVPAETSSMEFNWNSIIHDDEVLNKS